MAIRTRRVMTLFLGAVLAAPVAAPVAAELTFVWEDTFTAAEQSRLEGWIRQTHRAVESVVGPFPMDVHIHMHRREGAREPVPWANTRRYDRQGVNFHVDPGYPPDAFLGDWTAPHELSHLILPYVGRRHAWFAEGFASYMQYRVMQAMGELSAEDAKRRYRRHLERAARRYDYPHRPFVEAAPRLRKARQYPVMYWGGAAYFQQVDEALKHSGSSLRQVLREYLQCCRRDRAQLGDLLAELDRLAPAPVFTRQHARLATEPGFPDF